MTNHMWDGFWLLANRRAWAALPADVQEIAARELNQSALDERADLAALSKSTRGVLEGKGLLFNDVDVAPFRQALQKAGFYADWKKKFGDDAWAILESASGGLS